MRVMPATNRDHRHAVTVGPFRRTCTIGSRSSSCPCPRSAIVGTTSSRSRACCSRSGVADGSGIAGRAPGAANQLLRYEWPGNVRELENAMERAVALARGSRVELADLPGRP